MIILVDGLNTPDDFFLLLDPEKEVFNNSYSSVVLVSECGWDPVKACTPGHGEGVVYVYSDRDGWKWEQGTRTLRFKTPKRKELTLLGK